LYAEGTGVIFSCSAV